MDGSNGGTTFTDSNVGGSTHTWTAASVTTSTTQQKFGSASLSTGAAAGSITTPDSADFSLGAGDFTLDAWFYRSGGDGTLRFICGQSDNTGAATTRTAEILLGTDNKVSCNVWVAAVATPINGTTAFTTSGWHHVAMVRTGNTLKLFVDGTQEGGDVSFAGTINESSAAYAVGGLGAFTSLFWNGYIDEFRLSVGAARWTANFTPPAGPYS